MVVNKRIYISSPHMSDQGYEQEYVNEAFETNWIAPLGKNVDSFENELAEKVGTKSAVALVSGTAAIHMALKAVGVSEGDVVFCQSLTFAASANPIIYQNAIPVFIDSDYESWNMSPEALERAFKKYPKVKAVIAVHLYGIPANIGEITKICKKHHVPLIEDAAEALGTLYNGKYTGTFGDYGIYSFNGNKIITASGGGMLVCNRNDAEEKASKIKFWATQSRDRARYYQHSELGYNYRMSNIVAGIGRGQLKVLDERKAKKQDIYKYYKEAFADIDDIEMMPVDDIENTNCWLSCIQLSGQVRPLDIILALEEENIESRPIWKPMHMQPIFRMNPFITRSGSGRARTNAYIAGGAEDVGADIFARGLCLPSDNKMTTEEQDKIIEIVRACFD